MIKIWVAGLGIIDVGLLGMCLDEGQCVKIDGYG